MESCLGSKAARCLYSEVGATKFKDWTPTTWDEEADEEKVEDYTAILKTLTKAELRVAVARKGSFLEKIHSLVTTKNEEKKLKAAEAKAKSEPKRKAEKEQGDEPQAKASKKTAATWVMGGHVGERAMCTTTKTKEGWNGCIVTIMNVLKGTALIKNDEGQTRSVIHKCLSKVSPEEGGATPGGAVASGEHPAPAGPAAQAPADESDEAVRAAAAARAASLLGDHLTLDQAAAFAAEDSSDDDSNAEETASQANNKESVLSTDCETEKAFGQDPAASAGVSHAQEAHAEIAPTQCEGNEDQLGDASGVASAPDTPAAPAAGGGSETVAAERPFVDDQFGDASGVASAPDTPAAPAAGGDSETVAAERPFVVGEVGDFLRMSHWWLQPPRRRVLLWRLHLLLSSLILPSRPCQLLRRLHPRPCQLLRRLHPRPCHPRPKMLLLPLRRLLLPSLGLSQRALRPQRPQLWCRWLPQRPLRHQ